MGLNKHLAPGFSFHGTFHGMAPSALSSDVWLSPPPRALWMLTFPEAATARAKGLNSPPAGKLWRGYLVPPWHLTGSPPLYLGCRGFRAARRTVTLEPQWEGTPSPQRRDCRVITFWKRISAAKKCVVYHSSKKCQKIGIIPSLFSCVPSINWMKANPWL